jgi:hypothetical protein
MARLMARDVSDHNIGGRTALAGNPCVSNYILPTTPSDVIFCDFT